MEDVASITEAGLTAYIYQDEGPASPREYDNLGFLAFDHFTDRESGLGEVKLGSIDLDDLIKCCPVCDGNGYVIDEPDTDCEECEGSGAVPATIDEYFAEEFAAVAVIPVRFVDFGSSGAMLYAEDDEPNGVIFTTAKRIEELGVCGDDVKRQLEIELEELDCWIKGEVWGYVVKHEDGSEIEPATFHDSCWGFIANFGEGKSWDYLLDECKNACQSVRKCLDQEAAERAEWAARDTVTI